MQYRDCDTANKQQSLLLIKIKQTLIPLTTTSLICPRPPPSFNHVGYIKNCIRRTGTMKTYRLKRHKYYYRKLKTILLISHSCHCKSQMVFISRVANMYKSTFTTIAVRKRINANFTMGF